MSGEPHNRRITDRDMGKISDGIIRVQRTTGWALFGQILAPISSVFGVATIVAMLVWYGGEMRGAIRDNTKATSQLTGRVVALETRSMNTTNAIISLKKADEFLRRSFEAMLPEIPRYGPVQAEDDHDRAEERNQRKRDEMERRLRQYTDEQCSKC